MVTFKMDKQLALEALDSKGHQVPHIHAHKYTQGCEQKRVLLSRTTHCPQIIGR